ncbi:hypothetical protein [Pseudomonas fluorescens]|uniref:Uncharacterized protein n=1 Tax=Pseudomonas fluorescens TaxID=294 RepID=A0A5E7CQ90_PSEFL|nr:hypothetical protein [Pseudomonas fluorescens]VVN97501.1 hypothetical protein PS691_02359 [Pseudomonas fluorescens]
MKLERTRRNTVSTGHYVGEYPEDIYTRRGDTWFTSVGEFLVTDKRYITFENNDYNIEVDAEPVKGAAQGIASLNEGRNEVFVLPELPNPTTDTYEFHLTIAVGDDYTDKSGNRGKVTGKYFREMSGGRLKIGIYYA